MGKPKKLAGRILLVITVAGVVAVLGMGSWMLVPILTNAPQGASGQSLEVKGFPLEVSALGDDGRLRVLKASVNERQSLEHLVEGNHIKVTGSGFDARVGIYVAICQIPTEPGTRPGPCLGGIPRTQPGATRAAGAIEYAPANWINDDWAWKLFGARSFDNQEKGTFTAYIEVPAAADENVDCTLVRCGLFTRNDHTAVDDRVQDLYLPVAFAG